jgi:hypothetical protein
MFRTISGVAAETVDDAVSFIRGIYHRQDKRRHAMVKRSIFEVVRRA